jgi:hypothetical protein
MFEVLRSRAFPKSCLAHRDNEGKHNKNKYGRREAPVPVLALIFY